MKKIFTFLFTLPFAVLLLVLSVANRQPVMLRLDPFNEQAPAYALSLPLFVYVFGALLIGLVVGGMAVWFNQGRYRRLARERAAEIGKWRGEAEQAKRVAREATGQPVSGAPQALVEWRHPGSSATSGNTDGKAA